MARLSPAEPQRHPITTEASTTSHLRRSRLRFKTILLHVTLVFFCLIVLLPLWFIFVSSTGSVPDFFKGALFPQQLDLGNYAWVVQQVPVFGPYLFNTLAVTIPTVILTTLCAVLAGYALVHLKLRGRALLIAFLVATLFFPTRIVSLIGIFEINREFHLLNTRIGLILPYVALNIVLSVLIMRGVFSQIPSELVDAARLDGSSAWHTLWAVMLPLAVNGIVVVAMTNFLFSWGEFVLAMILNDHQEIQPIMVRIVNGISGLSAATPPRIFALYVLFIAPGITAFALLQRWFIKGLQEGALKN